MITSLQLLTDCKQDKIYLENFCVLSGAYVCVCACVYGHYFTFVSVVLMFCFLFISITFLSVVRGQTTQHHVLCKCTYITYRTTMLQHTSHLSLTCYVVDIIVPAHNGKAA
jgi:hypothetical protein